MSQPGQPAVDDGPQPGSAPDRSSPILARLRFSMADAAMLVLSASSASALFAEVRGLIDDASGEPTSWGIDAPALLVLAIVLTAAALGAYKAHAPGQVMLQVTLACLGYLTLIWLAEAERLRPLLYWFQAAFALLVAGPMVARRLVKSALPRGPRRSWWKKTLEAVVFSFLTILLVALGAFVQFMVAQVGGSLLG